MCPAGQSVAGWKKEEICINFELAAPGAIGSGGGGVEEGVEGREIKGGGKLGNT